MIQKSTEELEIILKKTHIKQMDMYFTDNADSLLSGDRPFSDYMRKLIKEKRLKQQDIFLDADIPERYGYKLISGERHTRQRDVILRLCYAAHFTLDETQEALKIYGMSQLYVKNKRDALLMKLFDQRPGSILEVNAQLKKYGVEALRTSGVQE